MKKIPLIFLGLLTITLVSFLVLDDKYFNLRSTAEFSLTKGSPSTAFTNGGGKFIPQCRGRCKRTVLHREPNFREFIGLPAEEVALDIKGLYPELTVVLVKEGTPLTMEYISTRLRIFYDANGLVSNLIRG
jgi:hypothetical protein